jgi:2-oxoglutarate ferredoxin oxidoreductase subunit delta
MSASPVQLDLELCKACGVCIELCPEKVFDRDAQGYPVLSRQDDCSQCLICELHCPDFAIEVARRERKGKGAGSADAPAPAREDLVTAVGGAGTVDDGCAHNHEEGLR